MDSRKEIQEKLQEVFDTVFFLQKVKVTPELKASDVEGWDSLTHILLVVETEKAFGIKFYAGKAQEVKNVGELMTLISELLQKRK